MKIKMKQFNPVFAKISGLILFTIGLILGLDTAYAMTAGDMAGAVVESFDPLARLIVATAYIAGLGFAIGAILKFKQHKDNPTQIPVGTPIALLFVAAALVFLPTVFSITGATLFGETGTTGGPEGTLIGS